MQRTTVMTAAGFLPTLAPAAAWSQTSAMGTAHLEHLVVESADTPAEHQALARYYRMEAADAKSLADEHRAMAKAYSGKPGEVRNMKQHCDKMADLNDQLATQYEDLAKAEDAAAKK